MQHVLDGCGVHACGSDFHGHAAGAEGFGFESVVLQFVGNFGEYRLLRGRQVQHDRHEQALAFNFLRGALLQHSFKKDALVGDVLVDDPEAIFVDGEDERIADLS